MINADKIKGKIVENKYNMSTFAEAMGMHRETLKLKLIGKREFSESEITKAIELLEIPDNEIKIYFLLKIKEKENEQNTVSKNH